MQKMQEHFKFDGAQCVPILIVWYKNLIILLGFSKNWTWIKLAYIHCALVFAEHSRKNGFFEYLEIERGPVLFTHRLPDVAQIHFHCDLTWMIRPRLMSP